MLSINGLFIDLTNASHKLLILLNIHIMPISRNITIDVARGFIILLMPAIHVTLLYSSDSVKSGIFGFSLNSVAEGVGAQLFMFVMGFAIVLSRKKSPRYILRRSGVLFCAAYCLNFLKFIIPALFGLLPAEFLSAYGISNDIFGYIELLFIGDILQFAALAYLLCGFLYLWKYGFYAAGTLACCIILFSPLFWDYRTHIIIIDLFIRFFNGFPPGEFFPFFPWGAYPLLGLFFGFLFLKMDSSEFYLLLVKVGVALFFVGLFIMLFEPFAYSRSFYRLGTGGTLFHTGIVLIWIRLCHELAVRKHNTWFVMLLSYLSRRITSIYIIQWILIFWLLSFFGFNQNNLIDTCFEVIGISLLTFLIIYLLERITTLNTWSEKAKIQ